MSFAVHPEDEELLTEFARHYRGDGEQRLWPPGWHWASRWRIAQRAIKQTKVRCVTNKQQTNKRFL